MSNSVSTKSDKSKNTYDKNIRPAALKKEPPIQSSHVSGDSVFVLEFGKTPPKVVQFELNTGWYALYVDKTPKTMNIEKTTNTKTDDKIGTLTISQKKDKPFS